MMIWLKQKHFHIPLMDVFYFKLSPGPRKDIACVSPARLELAIPQSSNPDHFIQQPL